MKGVIMKLVAAISRLFRRFTTGEPANSYEGIAFNAFRSALAVAFFPPGIPVVDDARR
jgi:hypothetical protein